MLPLQVDEHHVSTPPNRERLLTDGTVTCCSASYAIKQGFKGRSGVQTLSQLPCLLRICSFASSPLALKVEDAEGRFVYRGPLLTFGISSMNPLLVLLILLSVG